MNTTPDRRMDERVVQPARAREFAGGGRGSVRMRRRPAVVTITASEGGSYAEVLRRAREKVSLQELGIRNTKIRRAFNGGLIIEILGENGTDLASVLRDKLAGTLESDVKVDRPVAKGEIKITGIDPSTSVEEILAELTSVSGCPSADINISDRPLRDGMGIAWATCPLNVAITIVERGVLHLGWTRARVELLRKRPTQCFKCWRYGPLDGGARPRKIARERVSDAVARSTRRERAILRPRGVYCARTLGSPRTTAWAPRCA